jgi:superfamily I DNA/RNA helicase
MKVMKIRGLPGTGKTTWLVGKVIQILEREPLNSILFSSFSRSTMQAVREKLLKMGYDSKELSTSFRTIHSFSALALDLTKADFVSSDDYTQFCSIYGIDFVPFHVKTIDEIDLFGLTGEEYIPAEGNLLFAWWEYLKNKYITRQRVIRAVSQRADMNSDTQKELKNYSNSDLYKLFTAWERYKGGKYEYADILQRTLEEEAYYKDASYFFFDEAQDLSPLQFEVAQLWSKQSEELYFAYDTLQTLYFFNAADPQLVEQIEGGELVLPQSYRVPKMPWHYATQVAHYIGDHAIDKVKPTDKQGFVGYIYYDQAFEAIENRVVDGKKAFLLFRTHREADNFLSQAIETGIFLKGMGRISTCFNSTNFCAIYNLIRKLYTGEELTADEIKSFIISIPAKYLLRGKKTEINRKGIDMAQQFISSMDSHSIFYSLFKSGQEDVDGIKDIINDPKVKLSKEKRQILLNINKRSKKILSNAFVGTYFASKGLEADLVFLFDYFPRKDANIQRDEARLIFTGLTRTREGVYIVSPKQYFEKGLVYDLALGGV